MSLSWLWIVIPSRLYRQCLRKVTYIERLSLGLLWLLTFLCTSHLPRYMFQWAIFRPHIVLYCHTDPHLIHSLTAILTNTGHTLILIYWPTYDILLYCYTDPHWIYSYPDILIHTLYTPILTHTDPHWPTLTHTDSYTDPHRVYNVPDDCPPSLQPSIHLGLHSSDSLVWCPITLTHTLSKPIH